MKNSTKNRVNSSKNNKTFGHKVLAFLKGSVIAVGVYLILGALFSDFIVDEDYYEYTKTTKQLNDLLFELDELKSNGLETRKAELEKELEKAKAEYEKALEKSNS